MMKKFLMLLSVISSVCILEAAPGARKTFVWPTQLKYAFMPKQSMEFINGTVKNSEATALPDIDAKYSSKVRVGNLLFTLPDELCETMAVFCL